MQNGKKTLYLILNNTQKYNAMKNIKICMRTLAFVAIIHLLYSCVPLKKYEKVNKQISYSDRLRIKLQKELEAQTKVQTQMQDSLARLLVKFAEQ
jgi:hypothetical protein